MLWLTVTISAYFLLAIVALIDKYLISGPIPNPKVYAFYVGILGILALFLFPLGFLVPNSLDIILSLLAGALYIFALLGLIGALQLFEASRIVPAIGGFLPLSTFGLVYLFSGGEKLGIFQILAFISLIIGSILITFEKAKFITLKSLEISALTAFLFSLAFVLSKFVYLTQPFWSGFIWMRIGGFLAAIFFLFSKEVKEELFKKRVSFKPKTAGIFLSNQALGAGAFLLQNWAIALVPLGFLAFVNALEGTKYVFLLIFTALISLKLPQIIKEKISRKILIQKIIAILLIGGGLALLAI
ncbi:MAG: hypothetical protein COZ90_00550 [Candidatus Nealsonbacteria bacterium CG_4_8_14_3_um_filter_37_36]|uniref:EamA domain-containing protein n=4 Tax=Candidatus Nealsoniibacteriota TaxID=1817911 RepID=A0A2M7EB04_9BACT|nr:MAG: hypothetical protein COS09_02610 [Candidatus Nealsonbacteria bacterium CG01_land_8_20_14_3_00_12]PIW34912.1 MAG: hypothetical protein COW25_01780 [Candidatus Nealsonbacteria bacterium CG15_BIG_FIL_POST_REV_8_21_14_020_37_12]PIW91499.1 MAG: hypothetical protein COZ90_00550 [Candidatus Nealsonbacteria bacterium CG_4_8_14_3_um_filter_37_36]PJA83348.1 MAG: hypothetical protein CO146_01350 [Candidatus Nealsonbacteria bacterium CG_4_9_14_3_um_filter_37_29]